MLKYVIAALFFPVWTLAQTTTLESIEHDGLEREYLLFVPASYEEGTDVPLVFNFHGRGSTANEQFAYTLMTTLAAAEGFIVVYPNGMLDATDTSFWNAGFGDEEVDDVGFTIAVLDEIVAEYSIDESRVYSTGMSNGGYFSYTLACAHSMRFAAVASVTGSMVFSELDNCNPERPVPIMQIHGTADAVVAYDGNTFSAPIEDVVDRWVEINNCDTEPIFTAIADQDMEDGSTAEHYAYLNGETGNSVELYKIIGGGHTWPGAEFIIGVTNQDIDATELIWEFFSRYSIEEPIETGIESESGIQSVFPNPVLNSFQIRLQESTHVTRVYSIEGVELSIDSRNEDGLVSIDSSKWPSGIFLVSQIDKTGQVIRVDRLIK